MAERIPLSQVVSRIHEVSGMPKSHISAVLRGMKSVVVEELTAGNELDFGRDFGTFAIKNTPKRQMRVPTRPDEVIKVKSRRRVKFIPSLRKLKDL